MSLYPGYLFFPSQNPLLRKLTNQSRKWQLRQRLPGSCPWLEAEMTEQKAEKTEACYQFLIHKMYTETGGGGGGAVSP